MENVNDVNEKPVENVDTDEAVDMDEISKSEAELQDSDVDDVDSVEPDATLDKDSE